MPGPDSADDRAHDPGRAAPHPSRIVVPPQSGRAFQVARGDLIRIVDPQGQQVADLWAIVTEPALDWLSTAQTRDVNERLFPVVGQAFYSAAGQPLLTLIEDASPGPHDMLFPACNPGLYARVGLPGHPNCHDNFLNALASRGLALPFVPDPVDFFQNSPPQPDGRLEVLASLNPPGGYVRLRAECDLTLVVTACSIDFHPTNGAVCTEIEVHIERD
ncbi:urea carboxylase-associated family protein [Phreatobacter sp. AB_2022a]|uniref:urea carboxylase-associated family protein n=1 Tax=Phreatobacter sp. AB_2022a TaxID=3003134 RepID=UPI002286D89C|nr:urea carboxylase-associated family protein [Phreatobacter sp. AB_2022a]MCZ0736169.1 urea carboxylase-associated family protein [Phreatobacter sp. AB_2022a]